jgi:hypothetical protein
VWCLLSNGHVFIAWCLVKHRENFDDDDDDDDDKTKCKYRNSGNEKREMLRHTSNHWATRIVNKALKAYLETIPGKRSIDALQ